MNPLPLHRESLGLWLNEAGLTGTMAEIGCAHGGFSRIMLGSWKGSKYIMIDPWIHQDEKVYRERQEEAWKYLRWFEECSEIAGSDKRVGMLDALERLRDGDFAGTPINRGSSAMMLIEETLSARENQRL